MFDLLKNTFALLSILAACVVNAESDWPDPVAADAYMQRTAPEYIAHLQAGRLSQAAAMLYCPEQSNAEYQALRNHMHQNLKQIQRVMGPVQEFKRAHFYSVKGVSLTCNRLWLNRLYTQRKYRWKVTYENGELGTVVIGYGYPTRGEPLAILSVFHGKAVNQASQMQPIKQLWNELVFPEFSDGAN